MPDSLSLTIRNSLEEIEKANAAVEQFMAPNPVSPRASYALNLAIEEMLTNVIKYAFNEPGAHPIHLRLARQPGFLVLTIEDAGKPFDPVAAPEPDTGKPIEDRRIGGLGIHLVRNMVDEIRHRREHGRNITEIRIRT